MEFEQAEWMDLVKSNFYLFGIIRASMPKVLAPFGTSLVA